MEGAKFCTVNVRFGESGPFRREVKLTTNDCKKGGVKAEGGPLTKGSEKKKINKGGKIVAELGKGEK